MKALIIALGIASVLGVGALWLYAAPQSASPTPQPTVRQATSSLPSEQQEPSAAQTAASSAVVRPLAITHTMGAASAIPTVIPVGTSTQVTATIQITDPTLIANSVNLLRLGSPGTQPTILGIMQPAGNGMYSLQHVFNEAAAGQIQLQVSAAFQGSLQRVLSNVVAVNDGNTVSDASSGLSFVLPDLGTPPSVNDVGSTSYALFVINVGAVDPTDHLAHSLLRIFALPNPSKQDLQQWFEGNVDDASGVLLSSGAFQTQQFPHGSALVGVGPIPASYQGAPVAQAYMLAPSGDRVYAITQSQDGQLTDFGYSPSSVTEILASILGSVQ